MLAGASLWSLVVSVWMLVGMALEGIYVVFFMADVFVGDFFGAGVEELFVAIFMACFCGQGDQRILARSVEQVYLVFFIADHVIGFFVCFALRDAVF